MGHKETKLSSPFIVVDLSGALLRLKFYTLALVLRVLAVNIPLDDVHVLGLPRSISCPLLLLRSGRRLTLCGLLAIVTVGRFPFLALLVCHPLGTGAGGLAVLVIGQSLRVE